LSPFQVIAVDYNRSVISEPQCELSTLCGRIAADSLLMLNREVVVHQICKRFWILKKSQVEEIQLVGDIVEIREEFLMLLRVDWVTLWKPDGYSSLKQSAGSDGPNCSQCPQRFLTYSPDELRKY
jgi:hypothetical protein